MDVPEWFEQISDPQWRKINRLIYRTMFEGDRYAGEKIEEYFRDEVIVAVVTSEGVLLRRGPNWPPRD